MKVRFRHRGFGFRGFGALRGGGGRVFLQESFCCPVLWLVQRPQSLPRESGTSYTTRYNTHNIELIHYNNATILCVIPPFLSVNSPKTHHGKKRERPPKQSSLFWTQSRCETTSPEHGLEEAGLSGQRFQAAVEGRAFAQGIGVLTKCALSASGFGTNGQMYFEAGPQSFATVQASGFVGQIIIHQRVTSSTMGNIRSMISRTITIIVAMILMMKSSTNMPYSSCYSAGLWPPGSHQDIEYSRV